MFDQVLMDRVLKILIRMRAAKFTLETSIEDFESNGNILVLLEPEVRDIKSMSHYFVEFMNIEPKFIDSIEGFDNNMRIFDFVEDFAALYAMVPNTKDIFVEKESLENDLLKLEETKKQILGIIERADTADILAKEDQIKEDLRKIEYRIRLTKIEIERLSK